MRLPPPISLNGAFPLTLTGYAPPVAPLGALSFALHKDLATKHDGRDRWGYSPSTGASLTRLRSTAGGGNSSDWLTSGSSRAEAAGFHEFKEGDGPAWLTKKEGDKLQIISEGETVAQVDPLRLSKFLLGESLDRGVRLHHPAKVVGILDDADGVLSGVMIEKDGQADHIACSKVVITAGAWSPQVFSTLFPSSKLKLPITSLAGHSLVVRSPRWSASHEDTGCHAVFSTEVGGFAPEIFSRIGGEIYVAGLNSSSIPLPKTGADAHVDAASMQKLKEVARKMLGLPKGEEDDLEVIREGLCFRPVTGSGMPIVTRIEDGKLGGLKTKSGGYGGVFLSAGHGPWGIAQSVGTGKVLSELIEGVQPSADVSDLGL